jgi:2Fe-2S ferredoxin
MSFYDLFYSINFFNMYITKIKINEVYMITVTFIEHSGTAHEVKAELGKTLMETAMDAGVPGIDADCGGSCACGTCHVKVAGEWISKLPPVSDAESSMLVMTPEYENGSRLACQLKMDESLNGMSVRLPEFQM